MNNVNDRDYYEMERMVAEDVSMLSGKKLSFAEIILSFVPKEGDQVIRSRQTWEGQGKVTSLTGRLGLIVRKPVGSQVFYQANRDTDSCLPMHASAGNNMRQQLTHRLWELGTQKSKDGNNAIHQDSKNKVSVPVDLAWFRSIQIAQYCVATHLDECPNRYSHNRKDNYPVEEQQHIVGLEGIRTHGEQ